ncbi:MAG: DUF3796 domain-containing protein [Ruthenibacterium sp.]
MKHTKRTYTRKISPKLGLLGFLGFLGLIGFLPWFLKVTDVFAVPFPFFFFSFFAFFGFYYEGKMSGTFIDERFQANIYRAESIANKASLAIIIGVAIVMMSIFHLSSYDTLSVLIATIGLSFGLSGFLQSYLLFRFENEE